MTDWADIGSITKKFGAEHAASVRLPGRNFWQEAADEIERLRTALDQALDDMGDSHCVCHATKEMMQAAMGVSAVEQDADRDCIGEDGDQSGTKRGTAERY
jgi:hypothetical protein